MFMKHAKTLPLISVIVPVYNTSVYLNRCIKSILNQTYQNLEIILVDDGSTDESPSICDTYAQEHSNIKVIHQKNQGISLARNRGIEIAQGDFVGFVDSDDYCAPDMYAILVRLINRYQAQIAVANYYICTNGKIQKNNIENTEKFLTGEKAIISCVEGFGSFVWNKIFARDLFKNIKFPANALYEDLFTCYQLYDQAVGVATTKTPVYFYNKQNCHSITQTEFSIKKLDYFKASSALLAYCKKHGFNEAFAIIYQERIWHIVGFFRQMARANFFNDAIITPLLLELQSHIRMHLKGPHKTTNKIFALCCCINYKLTFCSYRFLSQLIDK